MPQIVSLSLASAWRTFARHSIRVSNAFAFVLVLVVMWSCVFGGSAEMAWAQSKRSATVQLIPNDSLYSRQWYLPRIGMERAWDASVGSSSVTIAIIAEGFDMNHPDLRDAWFVNPNDPIDGIDNDRNGYVDDWRGWDFVGNVDAQSASLGVYAEDNNPANPNANIIAGTHLAGIIGSRHNNGGIAGIAPGCRILPIKISNDDNSVPFITRLADAIRYAAQMGARVILIGTSRYNEQANNEFDANEQRVINDAIGTAGQLGAVVIAPAGEAPRGSTLPVQGDNFSYPASYSNVLAIGASGINDQPLSTSIIGTKMSLYAPGEQILSTAPGGGYAVLSGTRQAAAVAAGLAGLIISQTPNLSARAVIAELRATSDNVLRSGVASAQDRDLAYYGRVNGSNALTQIVPNMSVNVVNPLIINDPQTLLPQTALTNAITSLVNIRLRNYATQAQGTARNVRITVQPMPNTPLVTEQGAPTTVSYAEIGAGQVVSAVFRLRLTGDAFRTTAQSADILVNIVADNYRETMVVSIPMVIAPTDVINVVAPAHVDLGTGTNRNIRRDVPLVNGANSAVTVNSISLVGAQSAEFQIVSVNGRAPAYPLVIDSGAVANVAVRYATTANLVGLRTAQMNIRSSSATIGDTTYQVRLTANVLASNLTVSQASLIPSTIVGVSTSYTLTLQNQGAIPLANVRIAVVSTATGQATEFATSATTLASVPSGATIVWTGSFAPTQSGRRSAVVRITADNVPTLDYAVSAIGLQANTMVLVRNDNGIATPITNDDVLVMDSARVGGSKTITNLSVVNTALTSVSVQTPRFAGVGAEEFSATIGGTSASVLLPSGTSTPLVVTFRAQRISEKYVTMTVQSTGGIASVVAPTLISAGVPPRILVTPLRSNDEIITSRFGEPMIGLLPETLFMGADTVQANFPPVTALGAVRRFGVAVRNTGTTPITLNGFTIANPVFRVLSTFPKTLGAGQTDTLTTTFTPAIIGLVTGMGVLNTTIGGATVLDTGIVHGAGVRGALVVGGSNDGALSSFVTPFATTRVGSAVNASIPIANRGSSSGSVVVRMSGPDSSEFSIIRPFGVYRIDASTNDSINVRFLPRTPGFKNASVVVDLPNNAGSLRFPVVAQAVPVPVLNVSVSALNFGAVEEEDSSKRVIQIRGTDLTSAVSVSVDGHPAVYTPADTSRFARGRTYFPDDAGAVTDSLIVMVNPIRQPDTLSATITSQMEDISRLVSVSAVSIPFTKPVIRLPFAMTFDTVQTNITYLRSFGLLAANLSNDMRVTLPPGFELRNEEGFLLLSSSGTLRPWAPRIDSVLSLAFTPRVALGDYVDSVSFSSVVGTGATAQTIRTVFPITARVIPQPAITASVTTATFNDIRIGQTTTASFAVNFLSMATGGTVTVDMIGGDPRFTLLNSAGQDAGGIIGFQLASNATVFSTTLTIRFSPDSASTFGSSVRYSGTTINGDTLAVFTTLAGRGLPIPSLQATTTGVEFGAVRIFSNTPRLLEVTGATLTDTIRVRMATISTNASPSPFSVQLEDQRYLRNFVLPPNQFGVIDTSLVVWFEPFESGRFTDTLYFTSREMNYIVILGGTSSTVTSIRTTQDERAARIIPSMINDDAVLEIGDGAVAGYTLSGRIEILSASGGVRELLPVEIRGSGARRIPLSLKHLPQGAYLWRIAAQSKTEGIVYLTGKFIIVR